MQEDALCREMLYTNSAAKIALLNILNRRNTSRIFITKQANFPPRTFKLKLHACAFSEPFHSLKVRNQPSSKEIICEELLKDRGINSLHQARTMHFSETN